MVHPRIPLKDASLEQIATFAAVFQGIEVEPKATRAALIAAIKDSGYDKDDIPVLQVSAAGPSAIAPGVGNRRPRVKADGTPWTKPETGEPDYEVQILIPEQQVGGGSEPVFASVNGRAMYIPRATPVYVPEAYVEVLKNAVQLVYEPAGDKGLGEPREVPLIPFSYA